MAHRLAPTRTESVLKVRYVQYGHHRRLTVLRAIKNFDKNVKHIGVPFITKHVRFYLYDHTGDRMLPIYDSVMSSK